MKRDIQSILPHHSPHRRLRLNPPALITMPHDNRPLERLEHIADLLLHRLRQRRPFRLDRPFGDMSDARLQVRESLVVVGCPSSSFVVIFFIIIIFVGIAGALAFRRGHSCWSCLLALGVLRRVAIEPIRGQKNNNSRAVCRQSIGPRRDDGLEM